jgi:hypothetical protein
MIALQGSAAGAFIADADAKPKARLRVRKIEVPSFVQFFIPVVDSPPPGLPVSLSFGKSDAARTEHVRLINQASPTQPALLITTLLI